MPPVQCAASVVRVDDTEVLVIVVENATRVVGTTRGTYVRRALAANGRPNCIPYHAHEMLAHEIERGAVDYGQLSAVGSSFADLDPLEFERFRRLVHQAGPRADALLGGLADIDIASALGLVETVGGEARPRLGALLLFGFEEAIRRFVPTHEAAFQVLPALSVQTNDFFRWPLLRLAEELLARFRARNREEEIQYGLVRVAVPEYPEVAFREAMANALIHRDYTALGGVHVQWNDDALEISNPGGFPPGIAVDSLLVAPPRPRNPTLADAFKRAGLVERTGRGINRIFEAQLRLAPMPRSLS